MCTRDMFMGKVTRPTRLKMFSFLANNQLDDLSERAVVLDQTSASFNKSDR